MSGFYERSILAVDRPKLDTNGEFWRKEDPVFAPGTRELLKGGMFSHQREFWALPNFIKALVGGYGSGKTNIGSKRIIASALENAPCPVAAVSPTFQMARTTSVATITAYLQGKKQLYGRKFWWKYNKSSHEFTIRYHGRTASIIVYSGENPQNLKGPNLAAAWLDEPFIMDEEVFLQMIARVRHPDAKNLEILLTGTPEQLNWGYDLLEGDLQEKHDVGYVRASTRENAALDPAYVKRLLDAFDGKASEAYVDGFFVNLASGLVYYAFDRRSGVVVDIPEPEGVELGFGVDFNVNPMSAAVFWRAGNHMHFIEEFELPNADTEYLCQVLREKYGSRLTTAYPDATGSARKTSAPGGKTDFWYIRQAGFNIQAPHANPKRRDRYNAVNAKFGAKGQPTLTISPKCKKLIKYLSVHSHELMNKQQHMTHLLDAFSYPVSYLFPVSKETLGQHKVLGV